MDTKRYGRRFDENIYNILKECKDELKDSIPSYVTVIFILVMIVFFILLPYIGAVYMINSHEEILFINTIKNFYEKILIGIVLIIIFGPFAAMMITTQFRHKS